MKVCGCVVVYIDRAWHNDYLHAFNMYHECESDIRFRMEEWDNETFFECYYDMFDFIVREENLGEEDERKVYEKVEELCDYIVNQWKQKLPVIDWVEWGEINVDTNYHEVWMDTVYEVDCDYEVMYRQMKGERV